MSTAPVETLGSSNSLAIVKPIPPDANLWIMGAKEHSPTSLPSPHNSVPELAVVHFCVVASPVRIQNRAPLLDEIPGDVPVRVKGALLLAISSRV